MAKSVIDWFHKCFSISPAAPDVAVDEECVFSLKNIASMHVAPCRFLLHHISTVLYSCCFWDDSKTGRGCGGPLNCRMDYNNK